MDVSILISSYNREALLKRTLFSIAQNRPQLSFEVIVADDGSTDKLVDLLSIFNSAFPWKFISVDMAKFSQETGITKYHNNPSLTNNTAFVNSSGRYVFLMGNECIAWKNAFNIMISEADQANSENYLVLSNTYDLPQNILNILDDYGANLTANMVKYCQKWPLADKHYCSDVTNYLSLASRNLWEKLNGYDERYLAGIACEDSDFVRRARLTRNFQLVRGQAISLHQFHNGKTIYYEPTERDMNPERWNRGVEINRVVYNEWDNQTVFNQQPWSIGKYVKEVISNGY